MNQAANQQVIGTMGGVYQPFSDELYERHCKTGSKTGASGKKKSKIKIKKKPATKK